MYITSREFAQVIQAKVPEFIIAGESKLRSIAEELNRLEYSSKIDNLPSSLKVLRKVADFNHAVVVALEGNNTQVSMDEKDAGAEIKETLTKLIKYLSISRTRGNCSEKLEQLKFFFWIYNAVEIFDEFDES